MFSDKNTKPFKNEPESLFNFPSKDDLESKPKNFKNNAASFFQNN